MVDERTPHFLFAALMAGGNVALFQNLKAAIEARDGFDPSWLPLETFPQDPITRLPPFSWNWLLSLGAVMETRMRRLEERSGRPFDAAFYSHHQISVFLHHIRRRLPFLLAIDGTPRWFIREGLDYAHPPIDPRTLGTWIKHHAVRSLYRSAFHVLPLSSGGEASLIEDYGVPAEKVTVMPPGLDLERWQAPAREDRPAPSAERPLRVLFVGADFLRKGGDLVLSLAKRPELRDIELHFVTRSFTGEASANVVVHTGQAINSPSLIDLFAAADVFVLPTRADVHSVASLEAMAMGLPVVITKVGGLVDIVDEGRTGFLVEPGDVEALVDRLRRLAADRALRLDMGRRGRQCVEARFNAARNAELVIELLHRAARP
jgi:glycosyltransferase involved in cell wall biosynthesis